MSRNGLISIRPTSISSVGTSAAINSSNSIVFSAVTSLSVNGVFSAAHENYVAFLRVGCTGSTANRFRLRSSGIDATGNDYVRQYLYADGTTRQAAISSPDSSAILGYFSNTRDSNGTEYHFYGPFLSERTAVRTLVTDGFNAAYIEDNVMTHAVSSPYDGFTIFVSGFNITGTLQIFGYAE